MGESSQSTAAPSKSVEVRLESWKEIAAYLRRDVKTVQRWEKREQMPVHRHLHDKRGSVYASAAELDAWLESRRQRLDNRNNDEAAATADIAEVDPSPGPLETAPNREGVRRIPWLPLVAVALLAVIATGALLYRNQARTEVQPKIRSLAVLPLKNLSGDPSQEYLAEGITEALIGRLAAIHDLRVVSHTSVMRFKNPQVSTPEIARELHVDALVEGSVMRQGDRIRVTAQLIRGATDEHFWSETYDREMQDALALQSDLAQSIADKVEATVTGTERARLAAVRPVSPEVYESYLKGQFALKKENGRAGFEQSIAYFNDAIRKDPTFAPAYVGLAEANTDMGTVFAGGQPADTRPKVISAARKALELDPNLAEAHMLLANTLQQEWQWREAESEYRRALELNPNDAGAHAAFALWLACQGRTDEAIRWVQRGRELDPLAVTADDIAEILFLSHRYDEAIRELHSFLAADPGNASALTGLGFVLIADNRSADAIPVLEKAISITGGSPSATGILIRAYAHAGRRRDALRLLAHLKARRASGYVPAAAFVNAYLGLGDNDQAFSWLEQACNEKSNILQFLKTHPFFDPIRSDPRFGVLLRRVGLG